MILPGATLGLLGGGQLGRMFTARARSMGYEVVVLDPDPFSPAGRIATQRARLRLTGRRPPSPSQRSRSTVSAYTATVQNPAVTSTDPRRRISPRSSSR